jgi:hypothetical protein
MDIELAEQHIYVLTDRLTATDVQQRAMDRRTGAFGSGIGNLLQRPKTEDIELVNSQRRLEPFWHIGGRAKYVYDRSHEYAVPASGTEVREVTIEGQTHPVTAAGGREARSRSVRSNTAVTSSPRRCTWTAYRERRSPTRKRTSGDHAKRSRI